MLSRVDDWTVNRSDAGNDGEVTVVFRNRAQELDAFLATPGPTSARNAECLGNPLDPARVFANYAHLIEAIHNPEPGSPNHSDCTRRLSS